MSRGTWNRIKLSKFFYVQTYRRLILLIVASQAFNIMLCVVIIFLHIYKPEQTFYSTNGVTQPVQLEALDKPNYSEKALLSADPKETTESKPIPQ